MNTQILAGDIMTRVQAGQQSSDLNTAGMIAYMIQQAIDEEVAAATERYRQQLIKVGWCPDCDSEIQHEIDAPFSECNCPDGYGENTTIPLLSLRRYAIGLALSDLLDAASGHKPYPWNHEDNPYHKGIMVAREALGFPSVEVGKSNSDPGLCKEPATAFNS